MKITKRSGGPRTAEGKAAASRNSLKTGAYSKLVLLPGEDEEEFRKLEDQFIKDFSPQDIAESMMVRELAVIIWKKLRLERLEKSAVLALLNRPFTPDEYTAHGFEFKGLNAKTPEQLKLVSDGNFDYYKELFSEAEAYLNRTLSADELDVMENKAPTLFGFIINLAEEDPYFHDKELTLAEIAKRQISTDYAPSIALLTHAINSAYKSAENLIWLTHNKVEIERVNGLIKESRLIDFMELDKPRRVFDDLNRNFYRTLTELRKHQEWRYAKNLIASD